MNRANARAMRRGSSSLNRSSSPGLHVQRNTRNVAWDGSWASDAKTLAISATRAAVNAYFRLVAAASQRFNSYLDTASAARKRAALLAMTGLVGLTAVMVSAPLTVATLTPRPAAQSAYASANSTGGSTSSKKNTGLALADPDEDLNTADCKLTATQCAHARTIIDVGRRKNVPDRGIVIALAVAWQESKLKMLANDGTGKLKANQKDVVKSLDYPNDGVGRDHGSVNFMQQQYPIWGTLDELMNPEIAAEKFYDCLLETKDWQKMSVTRAAQKVQRSAYPLAYADDEPLARELLAELA
jgi:hypothetical protein